MGHSNTPCYQGKPQHGFTLVEMAVVVTIIGLLLAMGLAAATSMLVSSQRSASQERATFVRDALVAYFATNHRLPCPDTGSNVGNTGRDGVEDRTGGGATPDTDSNCAVGMGTVPYVTLGISRTQAMDAYGNFLTYRLDATGGWHRSFNFQAATCPASPAANLGVFTSPVVADGSAAAVLISHGANGLGAWNPGPTNTSRNALPTTGDELGNTQPIPAGPAGYRAYPFSDAVANPMDDIVVALRVGDISTVLMGKMGRTNICS
jgi:prepilin-type N-terminal cleavage/methylation domain-containing protein